MLNRAVQTHRRKKSLEGWAFLILGSIATFSIGLLAPMVVVL